MVCFSKNFISPLSSAVNVLTCFIYCVVAISGTHTHAGPAGYLQYAVKSRLS